MGLLYGVRLILPNQKSLCRKYGVECASSCGNDGNRCSFLLLAFASLSAFSLPLMLECARTLCIVSMWVCCCSMLTISARIVLSG